MARASKPFQPGDMIRTLVVILVPLLVITFLFTNNPKQYPVKVVDWRPVLTVARAQASYPVLAPVNLPPDWRATQVAWVKKGEPFLNGAAAVRNTWKLGFLTQNNVFIGLTQGDLLPDDLIKDETRAGVVDGQSTVGDQTWQRRVSSDDRTRSLVLSSTKPLVTTIVSGDVSYEALDAYASTLSSSG